MSILRQQRVVIGRSFIRAIARFLGTGSRNRSAQPGGASGTLLEPPIEEPRRPRIVSAQQQQNSWWGGERPMVKRDNY
jgi:hypothetical protein